MHNGQNYVVVHVTGYVKNAPPAGIDAPQTSCLVAIARLQIASMPLGIEPLGPNSQFTMRIAEDGKVTFVDQRASQLLSTPTEQLLGRFWWQIVHPNDEQLLHNAFRQLLQDQPFQVEAGLHSTWGRGMNLIYS